MLQRRRRLRRRLRRVSKQPHGQRRRLQQQIHGTPTWTHRRARPSTSTASRSKRCVCSRTSLYSLCTLLRTTCPFAQSWEKPAAVAPPPTTSAPTPNDSFEHVPLLKRYGVYIVTSIVAGCSATCCCIPTIYLLSQGFLFFGGLGCWGHYLFNAVRVKEHKRRVDGQLVGGGPALSTPIGIGDAILDSMADVLLNGLVGLTLMCCCTPCCMAAGVPPALHIFPLTLVGIIPPNILYLLVTGGGQTLTEHILDIHYVDGDSVEEIRREHGFRSGKYQYRAQMA